PTTLRAAPQSFQRSPEISVGSNRAAICCSLVASGNAVSWAARARTMTATVNLTLMYSSRHLQRRRIGAEPANGGFPHAIGRRVENQIVIDIAHQPRRRLELRLELAGSPSGIADNQPRIRRRPQIGRASSRE